MSDTINTVPSDRRQNKLVRGTDGHIRLGSPRCMSDLRQNNKLFKFVDGDVRFGSPNGKRVEATPPSSEQEQLESLESSNSSSFSQKPSSPKMYRVLLTGGPCAGKSTALSMLRTRLLSLGYHVVLVPENATAVFGNIGGYDQAWAVEREKHCLLQRTLLEHQMFQEKTFHTLAKLKGRDCVVLHDRGTLDVKAFMAPDEWSKMLTEMGKTEREMRESYDVVIHMITAAIGAREHYEFGEGSRNPERFHNADQAAEADRSSLEAYSGHPVLKIINNDTDFPTKVERVLAAIMEALGCPMPCRHRLRVFVEPIAAEQITVPYSSVDLWVVYLASNHGETRTVRKREQGGSFVYTLRTVAASKSCCGVGGNSTESSQDNELIAEGEGLECDGIVTEKQITEDQYNDYKLLADPCRKEVHKRLYYFTYEYRYFVLNEYVDPPSKRTILDCEVENMDDPVEWPPFIASKSPYKRSKRDRPEESETGQADDTKSEAESDSEEEDLLMCYTQTIANTD